jgi:mucin-19
VIGSCNAALYLSGVSTIALDNIDLSGTMVENGMTGLNVSNLTMNNCTINGAGNEAHESGMEMQNLSGICSITNTDISFSETNSLDIVNTDSNLTLTIDGSTFRDTQTVSSGGALNNNGEGGFQFRSFSNAAGIPVSNLKIKNSTFLRIRTQGIQAIGEDDSKVNIDITNCTINSSTGIGAGIDINGNDNSEVNFNVIGNPVISSRGGASVNITSFLDANVMGRVNDNPGIAPNGLNAGGSGIRAVAQETSNLIIQAKNNTITMGATNNSTPIDMQARFQTARIDITLDNNTIQADPTALASINITAGSSGADETNPRVYANVINNDVGGAPNVMRLRVSDLDGTTNPLMFLQGFVEGGAGIEDDAVATWNGNLNTPVATTSNVAVSLTGSATGPLSGTALTPSNPLP